MKRVPNWIAAGVAVSARAASVPGLELRVLQLAALGGRRAHN
jgi:hypothetical protein